MDSPAEPLTPEVSIAALISHFAPRDAVVVGSGRDEDAAPLLSVAGSRPALLSCQPGAEPSGEYDAVIITAPLDARMGDEIGRWLPHVRSSGVIMGKGYNAACRGVQRAVAARFDLMDVGLAPCGVWFYQTKGQS